MCNTSVSRQGGLQLAAYMPIELSPMFRLLVTLATIVSILLGTGSFNVMCLCGPRACAEVSVSCAVSDLDVCAAEPVSTSECASCCCDDPDEPAPKEDSIPGQRPPERCPCLYWTNVPLSTSDTLTGLTLVKRAIELAPVLLLEAVSAPLVHETAGMIRAGPLGQRDTSVRLQAWHCVWTI
jgi:hypothetical protein